MVTKEKIINFLIDVEWYQESDFVNTSLFVVKEMLSYTPYTIKDVKNY